MEQLQMLKFSIRGGKTLNFTEGFKWSEELREMEFLARTAPVGDPESYGRSLTEGDTGLEKVLEELERDNGMVERLMSMEDEEMEDECESSGSSFDIIICVSIDLSL